MPSAVLVPRCLEEELTNMDETCLRRQRSERDERLEAREEIRIAKCCCHLSQQDIVETDRRAEGMSELLEPEGFKGEGLGGRFLSRRSLCALL